MEVSQPATSPKLSTNGCSNGVKANGQNGVHHDQGQQGSGEHEELQYLNLIRRIIETGQCEASVGQNWY